MFEQVSAARWTIVHFVLAEIQGGERDEKKAEFPLQKDKKCRCNWDIWECLVSGSRGEMKPVRLERLTDSKASPLRLTFSLASPSSPLFFPRILSLLYPFSFLSFCIRTGHRPRMRGLAALPFYPGMIAA